MTEQGMVELNRSKDELKKDFRAVITDSEDLLKAAVAVSGEKLAPVRTKFQEKWQQSRDSLASASRGAVQRTRDSAAAADQYVHHHPWTAIGIAAAVGILMGALAVRR